MTQPIELKDIPPITKLVDDGIEKEIKDEFERWNTRNHIERYPLSPSGIGKCALKLARDLAHYHGLGDYPRSAESRTAKLQRVFSRGHLLEKALIEDVEKYTTLKVKQTQQRVHLFDVTAGEKVQAIEGDIDGLVVFKDHGARILIDFKSKGAYYSAGFNDSISEFFENLRETGLVDELGHNSYIIKDVYELFKILPLDDFFVDYLHQLNSYAFSDWFRRVGVDGVALYYENKNTCQNYEVRWKPSLKLFQLAKDKYQYIYSTVQTAGAEKVEREFGPGSTRCRLCEYNELCNGKFEGRPNDKKYGKVDEVLENSYKQAVLDVMNRDKLEEKILLEMEKKGLTHFTTSGGITYERKFLKSPKPHYELRLAK
jgi:hypothetical protein